MRLNLMLPGTAAPASGHASQTEPFIDTPTAGIVQGDGSVAINHAIHSLASEDNADLWVAGPVCPMTWTDEMGEFVLLGRKEKAFGFSAPTYALTHWWIKSPSAEASMGPARVDWGTEAKIPTGFFQLLSALRVKITNHAGYAEHSRDVVHHFQKVHGPPGFTVRVEQRLVVGKRLGWISPWNNCQTFCRDILRRAGGVPGEIPPVFTLQRALDTFVRIRVTEFLLNVISWMQRFKRPVL